MALKIQRVNRIMSKIGIDQISKNGFSTQTHPTLPKSICDDDSGGQKREKNFHQSSWENEMKSGERMSLTSTLSHPIWKRKRKGPYKLQSTTKKIELKKEKYTYSTKRENQRAQRKKKKWQCSSIIEKLPSPYENYIGNVL